jgi:excisionase family DNA binding protein
MPRTKPQLEKPQKNGPSVVNEAQVPTEPAEVLDLAQTAAYLKLAEADVLRLVGEQGLPARRLGNQWRFLKAAIQQWLSTSPPKANKEAWMALAGAWKDDPYVEQELKEIYKRRGRPMTKDEA